MFKPKKGERYYYISRTLRVITDWYDDIEETRRYTEVGNCFETGEEAEVVLEKIKPFFNTKQQKKAVAEEEPMEDD